jgi:hypothetical protein
MFKKILAATGFCLIAGCGGSGGSGSSPNNLNTSSSFTYCYSENGCSTGTNTFSSVAALCKALAEDNFNRGCAYDIRREAFDSDCAGTTWDPSDVTPQQPQTQSSLNCGN